MPAYFPVPPVQVNVPCTTFWSGACFSQLPIEDDLIPDRIAARAEPLGLTYAIGELGQARTVPGHMIENTVGHAQSIFINGEYRSLLSQSPER